MAHDPILDINEEIRNQKMLKVLAEISETLKEINAKLDSIEQEQKRSPIDKLTETYIK